MYYNSEHIYLFEWKAIQINLKFFLTLTSDILYILVAM